jgi:predicted xylose isomerase-like sugar epimerase
MLHREYVSIREDLDMYSASVKKSEEKTSSLFDVVKTNSDQFSRMANMGYVGQYSQDDISEIKEKLSSIEESINIIKINKIKHIKNDSDAIESIEGDISRIHNIISDREKR